MKRRSFLAGMIAAVATRALPAGDGVALIAAEHPQELMIDIWIKDSHYERWPVSMLKQAALGDRLVGVVVGRPVEATLYCGDMVSLRGSGGMREFGRRAFCEHFGVQYETTPPV